MPVCARCAERYSPVFDRGRHPVTYSLPEGTFAVQGRVIVHACVAVSTSRMAAVLWIADPDAYDEVFGITPHARLAAG